MTEPTAIFNGGGSLQPQLGRVATESIPPPWNAKRKEVDDYSGLKPFVAKSGKSSSDTTDDVFSSTAARNDQNSSHSSSHGGIAEETVINDDDDTNINGNDDINDNGNHNEKDNVNGEQLKAGLRRCSSDGCTKCAQGKTPYCIRHGGES